MKIEVFAKEKKDFPEGTKSIDSLKKEMEKSIRKRDKEHSGQENKDKKLRGRR